MSEHLLFDNRPRVTTKGAAKLLKVTEATIYRYEKEGKLSSIYKDNWYKDGTKVFFKEDVEKLLEDMKKPGLTIQEVAKRVDVSHSTVSKWIQTGVLSAEKKEYKGKETYFIQEEDVQVLSEMLPSILRKYEKKQIACKVEGRDVYLYQSFQHKETKEYARIIAMDGEKGKVVTESEEVFPLEELFARGYEPTYIIEGKRHSTKRGQARFAFKKPHLLQGTAYKVIEWIYVYGGAANLKIDEKDQMIHVEVKPVVLEVEPVENQMEIEYLAKHLQEGELSVRNNGVYIESGLEAVSFHVEKELKNQMKEAAKREGIGLEEWLKKLVSHYFEH
ncbi:helix-turn-helix domain-containing protein [Ectobacillus panaciterrae]|uniref:helix-turn-helix domain-containing protein n=1 Tax=Ectobacillus panaciterrae TaxID=363872 RepID=UPI0004100AA8|nr:helix-turn-helix domain-containing protein [Ectobacillus panaciterrae]